MAEGDSRNRKYPFSPDGTTIDASATVKKPDSGYINTDGASIIWLTGKYTGDASSVTVVVYGLADEDDNEDPIATMTLDSSKKHAKIQVPAGLPFATLEVTNNDAVNTASFAAIINMVR